FAQLKLGLLERRLQLLAEERARLETHKARREEERDRSRVEVDRLKRAVAEQGGDRLEQLAAEIREHERERDRRRQRAERYAELLRTCGEKPAGDESAFVAQRNVLAERRERLAEEEAELQNRITEMKVALLEGKREHDALRAEIASLKARRSNIPSTQVAVRAALCVALQLDEETMPFAGELIRVREEAAAWEGAI